MNNYETSLYSATVKTFEELCFMFRSPEAEDGDEEGLLEGAASVTFFGPFKGRVVIKVYGGLLNSIVSNMLGEMDCTKGQQLDALGEIINVICGNILPEIAGQKEIFNIGSPMKTEKSEELDSYTINNEKFTASVNVSLDEGRAVVELFVDSNASILNVEGKE